MVRNLLRFLWIGLAACGMSSATAAGAFADTTLTIGVLAYRGSETARGTWEATAAEVAAALPGIDVRLRPLHLDALTAAAAAGELDFVITNPGHSVQLSRRTGASRVATARTMATEDQTRAVGSVIVVRSDGRIHDLEQLRGRTLGVVAADAFGGHLVAQHRLVQVLGPKPDVRLAVVGFPHQAVVAAVLDGTVDAGVVRACLIESLADAGELDPGHLRILGLREAPRFGCRTSTALYPGWAFLKMPHVSPDLATTVTRALLAMARPARSDPWLGHDGWIAPVSYAAVEAVYRDLGLYPFATDLTAVVGRWLRENLAWVTLGAVVLGLFLLHFGRVEILVRRRSRELEKAAQRVRSLEGELAHAERVSSMSILAGSLAHDLNQPLAAISTYAHGLLLRHQRGTADATSTEAALRNISEQANRASAFIRSMRGFLTKQPARRENLDLRDLVGEVATLMRSYARKHDCALHWHRPADPYLVCGDGVQLRQVVVALVQNGIEATVGPGTVSIRLDRNADCVELTVADGGPGMTEEVRQRAFEPFYSTKGSLGLGLATAATIVERHEGRLALAPGPENGTVARLSLPETAVPAAGDTR